MTELKKNLGFWTIVSVTITAMIGTGLFFGIATAAGKAGNASILSWALLAILTVYVGACFGELTSMYPNAGGIYEFSKHAYGKGIWSFLIGWSSWVVINMMNALLIVAALEYIMPPEVGIIQKAFIATLIIILLNFLAYFGTEKISATLGIFAAIILVVLIAMIFAGVGKINYANYSPFFSAPLIMIFFALFFIVETFFGWETATFMAEETVDAEKIIPKALVYSSIFVSALGLLLAIVVLGVIPWQTLSGSMTPIADFTSAIFNSSFAIVIKFGIALALIGSAAGGMMGSPRLLLGLARDKLFIEQLADIHPEYQTPYKAIIFQTVVSVLVMLFAFGNYNYLLSLLVPLALLMYISIILTVTILRYKNPQHPRPFKAWFGKIGPIVVSLIYAAVIILWLYETPGSWGIFKLGLSIILFGIPIFLLLKLYYDMDFIRKVNDSAAHVMLLLEGFNFPKKFRKELLGYFEDLNGKTVLEFGSGVGTLTLHLADAVGPNGKVYATDMSSKNMEILQKRLMKKGHTNVELIYDEHQMSRVHPNVKNVDVIFSVGMLSYLQDPKKVLKEMHKLLPKNGKICMVEYVDYFWILPNVKWLSNNETIEQLFRDCGFSVHVKRKRQVLWSYAIIYGIKSDNDLLYI